MSLRQVHRSDADTAIMWRKVFLRGLAVLMVFAAGSIVYFFYSWGTDGDLNEAADERARQSDLARPDEPILPITAPTGLDTQKVALGQLLFRDTRLSRDNTVSCASCHDLLRGGVDRLPRSRGVGGAEGDINAPTVYNSGLNFRQFWDGRADTLEEQVEGPITNPVEMASSWEQIIPILEDDSRIRDRFRAIYNGSATPARVKEVIAEFERSLVTPSRFDRWLKGDDKALSAQELEGYRLFKRHGCIACHQGVNVGGNIFQKFGVMLDYFADRPITKADLGRFNVTGREEDKHVFKVPSLRNVALTAPYFHDAAAQTLPEAVAIMGRHQLGVDLPAEEVQLITLFLTTLTGERL
ncbi:MAG: cytochrome-c peroxidase [Betaproteobacteria bacterium]|nr:cytochrome-c peroxidase [Betaproteobacteria bacterium]